jgi:hypothetical protein
LCWIIKRVVCFLWAAGIAKLCDAPRSRISPQIDRIDRLPVPVVGIIGLAAMAMALGIAGVMIRRRK